MYYWERPYCYPVISPSGRYVLYIDEDKQGKLQGHIVEIMKPKSKNESDIFSLFPIRDIEDVKGVFGIESFSEFNDNAYRGLIFVSDTAKVFA